MSSNAINMFLNFSGNNFLPNMLISDSDMELFQSSLKRFGECHGIFCKKQSKKFVALCTMKCNARSE